MRYSNGLLAGLIVCGAATVSATSAWAQPSRRIEAPSTQLAMPPDTVVGERRQISLTQVNPAGVALGPAVSIDCPRTGCETLLNLVVEETTWRFFANISFVNRGLYMTLEPRSIGISGVMEFSAGHPGPIFVPFRGQGKAAGQIGLVITRDASVRAQERESNPNAVSNGGVFARKREPDILMQLEASALIPGGKPKP